MADSQNYEYEIDLYQNSLTESQDHQHSQYIPNPDEYTKSSRTGNRRQNNKKHRKDEYFH